MSTPPSIVSRKHFLASCSIAFALFSAAGARAESDPVNHDPLHILEGSSIGVRYRNQHDGANKRTYNQMQYSAEFKLTLQIDRAGKLKLKAIVGTDGPGTFNSDAENLGIGNNTDFGHDLYLKNFYIDYQEGKSHLEIGALPATPSGVNGAFNIDANGWVHGGFYQYTIEAERNWIRDVSVMVGQMDIMDSPQIWKRDFGFGPGIIQIHVRGDLSKIAKYTVEATDYENDQYLRGILDIATKDILKFVDQISIEEMIGTGNQVQQGFAVSLKKKLKSEVLMSVVYSRKEDLLNQKHPQIMMMEDNFRPGDQLTFKIEKPINKAKTIVPYLRVSKTLNKAIDLPMTSGGRVDVGLKINLPKSKKRRN